MTVVAFIFTFKGKFLLPYRKRLLFRKKFSTTFFSGVLFFQGYESIKTKALLLKCLILYKSDAFIF